MGGGVVFFKKNMFRISIFKEKNETNISDTCQIVLHRWNIQGCTIFISSIVFYCESLYK